MANAVSITGLPAIDAKLARLKGAKVRSIARTAITKSMRVIVRGIKSEVPGGTMRDLKRTVGYSVKTKNEEVIGKAGPGVGKSRGKRRTRTKKRGVGIGKQNAHWFVLGTQNMPPQAPGVVQRGTATKMSEVKLTMKNGFVDGINKAVK